jgi:hypothetical protein
MLASSSGIVTIILQLNVKMFKTRRFEFLSSHIDMISTGGGSKHVGNHVMSCAFN